MKYLITFLMEKENCLQYEMVFTDKSPLQAYYKMLDTKKPDVGVVIVSVIDISGEEIKEIPHRRRIARSTNKRRSKGNG